MKAATLCIVVASLILVSCSAEDGEKELLIMSHDSFDISEEVLNEFEEEHGVTLVLLPSGDTGAALNQAILTREDPLADVFFGVDNTFLSRALEADIFVPNPEADLDEIAAELVLDQSLRLVPVDYGDVCINYDIGWFEEREIQPPSSLEDLLEPEYEGLLVVENPATSSPGLAFLLATIDNFGTDGTYSYLDYWKELRDNDVLVVDGWEEAYYGHFTVPGDGDRPLVVSYASSPPAEVYYADPPVDAAPTASVAGPGSCFRQVEFAGVLKGTEKLELARAFIDFMLSKRFQEDIPLHMFVFPANSSAALPDVFVQWADEPEEPAQVDPEMIGLYREDWIRDWTEAVLR